MSSCVWSRRAVRALVMGTVVLGSVGAAGASASDTVRVDNDRAQCPTARFRSISAALEVVGPGSTVVVCPGAYAGPLRLDKLGVRVVGATGKRADVVLVPSPQDETTPVVEMSAPITTLAAVTIRDRVAVDPSLERCSPPLSVLVDNGPGPFSNASVIDNVAVRQRATPLGSRCTFDGVGVEIGRGGVGGRPGQATVRNSFLAARARAVEVQAGSTASIHDNVIAGANTTFEGGLNFSGVGIRVEGGAVRIQRNDMSGYIFAVDVRSGRATVGGPGAGTTFTTTTLACC